MNTEAFCDFPKIFGIRNPIILIGFGILIWYLTSEGVTEAWYRWKESQVPSTQPWMIDWPTEENAVSRGFRDFQPREMSDRERELLRFKVGRAASWQDAGGNRWTGFYLEWEPDRTLNQSDIAHNPTLCLPAAGLTMVSRHPDIRQEIGNQSVTFTCWKFEANDQPVFVFLATRWPKDFSKAEYRRGYLWGKFNQLVKALIGNRDNPLQNLELVVVGATDIDQARIAFEKQVQLLISP